MYNIRQREASGSGPYVTKCRLGYAAADAAVVVIKLPDILTRVFVNRGIVSGSSREENFL